MAFYIKLAMFAIASVMAAKIFQNSGREYGFYIGICAAVLIMGTGLQKVFRIAELIGSIKGSLCGLEGYLLVLARMLGITYVCDFASSICRDAGHGAAAGQLEILGKLCIMTSGISILLTVVGQINQLLL